jgi:hypothetical protein
VISQFEIQSFRSLSRQYDALKLFTVQRSMTDGFVVRHASVISCLCLMLHVLLFIAGAISFPISRLRLSGTIIMLSETIFAASLYDSTSSRAKDSTHSSRKSAELLLSSVKFSFLEYFLSFKNNTRGLSYIFFL